MLKLLKNFTDKNDITCIDKLLIGGRVSIVRRRLITEEDILGLNLSDKVLSEDLFVTYYPQLSPSIGLNGSYGDYVEWNKPDTVRTFSIGGIKLVLSGINVDANEQITIELTLCFNDNTCNSIERTFSVDGVYNVSDMILDVLKDNVFLTGIKARAKSNQATTNATVDLYIYITVM